MNDCRSHLKRGQPTPLHVFSNHIQLRRRGEGAGSGLALYRSVVQPEYRAHGEQGKGAKGVQGVTVAHGELGLGNSLGRPRLPDLPLLDVSKNEEGAIRNGTGPGRVARLFRVLFCSPKGWGSDPQSGSVQEATDGCFFLSLSKSIKPYPRRPAWLSG